MTQKKRSAIKPRDREIPVETESAEWREALEAWDARLNTDQAVRAVERFESIAKDEEENADAWAWCARAHYFLGDYQKREKDRGRLHEAGANLGRRGVDLDKNHIGALFWTACCLGSYIETVHILKRALYAPEVVRLLLRVHELEPEYYHHGLARFLGQAIARQPILTDKFLKVALPDMSGQRILEELGAAIEKGPPFVLNVQTVGELAWCIRKDKKRVRECLQRLDTLELDADPNLAPENHLDLPRARERLAELL